MENLFYALLLAIHNLILVIFAGGMLSVWLLTRYRPEFDQKALQAGDHLLERSMIAHPEGYLRGLILLGLTGGGMPLVHYLYHGQIREQTLISGAAFGAKLLLVALLLGVLIAWMVKVERPLSQVYPKTLRDPGAGVVKDYFLLAAQRTTWCWWGWVLSVLVLLTTPFVTYFQR